MSTIIHPTDPAAASSGSTTAPGYALAESPTIGTSFEVDQAGLLRLASSPKPITAVADAKTNPPGTYTVENASNLTSSEMNTVAEPDAWNFVIGTGASTWSAAGTHTAPGANRPVSGDARFAEWIFRVRCNSGDPTVGATHCYFMAYDTADLDSFMLSGLAINPGDAILAILYDGSTARTVALGTGARDDGTWFRLRREYDSWTLDYNVANQTDPPTSWTSVGAALLTGPGQGTQVQVGPSFQNASTAAYNADLLHCSYRDSDEPDSVGMYVRSGYDTASPTQRFVLVDLGSATATIADADLQAALAAVENTTVGDTATLTYSFVRDSSSPPAAGTYAAAASVTVSGTGQYLAGYVKMLATATQGGSVALDAFRVAVT
jgi:hypothetical protein